MGGFLVSPLNCACPPTASPPGDYVTRWRIDPVTGCWWLMDQTIPSFSIPCPTQISGPTGVGGGGGYGTSAYGTSPGAGGTYGTPTPNAAYYNGTSCNQMVYYSVAGSYDMRLNNVNQASGYSRQVYAIQTSNDNGSSWSTLYQAGRGVTGLYYDSPTFIGTYSQIVGPGATFQIRVRFWWGNYNTGSVIADNELASYVNGVPLFSVTQLPT